MSGPAAASTAMGPKRLSTMSSAGFAGSATRQVLAIVSVLNDRMSRSPSQPFEARWTGPAARAPASARASAAARTEIVRVFLFTASSDGDLFQTLFGPLLDVRRQLAGGDERLEGLDRLGLAHLDQEIDERDLDERVALGRQRADQRLAHAGPVAEEVQGVDGGQADVGIGVVVDGLEKGVEGRRLRVLDLGAVADALEPVGGRGLVEQR